MDKRIEKFKTPEPCEIFAKNAEEHNRPDLAKAARQKAIDLRADQYGASSKSDWRGAMEFNKATKESFQTKLSRTVTGSSVPSVRTFHGVGYSILMRPLVIMRLKFCLLSY